MKNSFKSLLVAATLLTTFPAFAEDAPKAPAKDYVIVKFGAQQLTLNEVLETWKTLFPGGNAPDFNNFDENIRQNVKIDFARSDQSKLQPKP
jgi:hypothetical protein